MMKKYLALLGFMAGFYASEAWGKVFEYEVTVIEVVDGDTVKVTVHAWPEPLQEQLVRVNGIDTPEKGFRAKCTQEAFKGERATEFAKTLAKAGDKVEVRFDTAHKDKFGRLLSDVYFDDGSTWSEKMIKRGLAKPYYGEAKGDWCAP